MAEQGIQVSRARVGEILTTRYLNQIANLQQELAEMTAVNEALMERINANSNGAASNGKALSEGINDASPNGHMDT